MAGTPLLRLPFQAQSSLCPALSYKIKATNAIWCETQHSVWFQPLVLHSLVSASLHIPLSGARETLSDLTLPAGFRMTTVSTACRISRTVRNLEWRQLQNIGYLLLSTRLFSRSMQKQLSSRLQWGKGKTHTTATVQT